MIRTRLSDRDSHQREGEFRRAKVTTYRDRLPIVRLAARGRPRKGIAAGLGLTPRALQRWLNRYADHGLVGLGVRKAGGATARIPADLAQEARRWVVPGPQAQGLDRAGWTHAELAEHHYRTRGIRACRSAMQRFCQKLGVRVYRPAYRFLRGDPEKLAAAREELAALKEGRMPAVSSG